eukprot:TRINITY_DN12869_c0_g1_i1.p1 TRINITY_DN12869_c0_g1~~TRINITY_DN12869_c0_g1_i1.p1  ORF type:complete len:314 (+),score=72.99 TRINITY_DN12869_c0_g1_i1:77-1018(+)
MDAPKARDAPLRHRRKGRQPRLLSVTAAALLTAAGSGAFQSSGLSAWCVQPLQRVGAAAPATGAQQTLASASRPLQLASSRVAKASRGSRLRRHASDSEVKLELETSKQELQGKLDEVAPKWRRAEAFKLDGRDELKAEVSKLEAEITVITDRITALEPKKPEVEVQTPKVDAATPAAAASDLKSMDAGELREKLTWENLSKMSGEERLELAKQLGPAFAISLGIVATIYWSITLPVFVIAFHETTGSWPGVSDIGGLGGGADGAATAGALAGLLSFAFIMKPVRWIAAMWLTPWTAERMQEWDQDGPAAEKK